MGYSIRTDQWRYTEWENGKRGVELYDESADPRELKNLATDPTRAKIVAAMRDRLRHAIEQGLKSARSSEAKRGAGQR